MATATVEQILQDSRLHPIIPKLPSNLEISDPAALEALAEEYKILVENLLRHGGGIFGIGRKMPNIQVRIHKERIRQIEGICRLMEKTLRALTLGYEPYHPPAKWYVGWLLGENERDQVFFPLEERIFLTFVSPLPHRALEKYRAAKRTGLFSVFLVATPDQALFQEARTFAEPALIGYVGGNSPIRLTAPRKKNQQQPGLKVADGVGFLIDMWDMEKDRRAAGMNF